MKDCLQPYCISCKKQCFNENREKTRKFYLENSDKNLNRNKDYYSKNHDKIIAHIKFYFNMSYKSDIIYRLIHKTRCRIRKALNGKSKSSSTIKILGIDNKTYRKRIKSQFTPEMNWLKFNIDHVEPI